MKVALVLVGKTVNKHFVELIDEYAGRVKHYIGFDIITIPELKNTKSLSADQQKQQEGELILKQMQAGDHVRQQLAGEGRKDIISRPSKHAGTYWPHPVRTV